MIRYIFFYSGVLKERVKFVRIGENSIKIHESNNDLLNFIIECDFQCNKKKIQGQNFITSIFTLNNLITNRLFNFLL